MKLSRTLFCVAMSLCIGVGASAGTLSAEGLKQRAMASRLWKVCTQKVPKLVRVGAEGTVTAYSAYLALTFAKEFGFVLRAVPQCNCTLEGIAPVVHQLISKGCVVAGLSLLAYKAVGRCLDDLEAM